MSTIEAIKTAQFVIDSKGQKKAVILEYKVWEELLSILEDLEDVEEMKRLRESDEEVIPWEQAKREMQAEGIDV